MIRPGDFFPPPKSFIAYKGPKTVLPINVGPFPFITSSVYLNECKNKIGILFATCTSEGY